MESRKKPFISIILPCYNEEAILEINVKHIINYLENNSETQMGNCYC